MSTEPRTEAGRMLNEATYEVMSEWTNERWTEVILAIEAEAAALTEAPSSERDEDIRADIRQAGMGGPDFTPKEWPEAPQEESGLMPDDRKFLLWCHERFAAIFHESPNLDWMQRLRALAASQESGSKPRE